MIIFGSIYVLFVCICVWTCLQLTIFLKENQMEKLQQFDSQFQKNILSGLSIDQQTLKMEAVEHQVHVSQGNRELSIDQQQNSLALLGRNSIQNVMPIPRSMLSHSQQMEKQVEDEQGDLYFNHKIKVEVSEEDKEWFVEQLGLNELLYLKKFPSNTKNVLRNFGNAQNQYVLYHQQSKDYLNQKLVNPQRFYAWVRNMKLQKFDDFKAVWNDDKNKVFKRVYRYLCYRFYKECSIPYVLISRMKSTETKLSHLRYIYRFLQGLKEPDQFNYFKKVQR